MWGCGRHWVITLSTLMMAHIHLSIEKLLKMYEIKGKIIFRDKIAKLNKNIHLVLAYG